MNPWRKYRQWQPNEFVLCYADTAWAGMDFCAAQLLSKDTIDIPLVYHQQGLASDMTPRLHEELERIFDITKVKPVVSYERNNGGVAELERLRSLNRLQKYRIYTQYAGIGTTDDHEMDSKLGHDTNTATRPAMLAALKDAIDNHLITIYDKLTVEEMFSFIVKMSPGGQWKAQAETGAHDDLIMSLAGVWQMYMTESRPKAIEHRRTQVARARFHV